MTIKHTADGFAVVNSDYEMFDAKVVPPPSKGVFICGNIKTGKGIISHWDSAFDFTHWAPLPVFPKPKKENHESNWTQHRCIY